MRPVEAWMGRDLVCVLENEEQVFRAVPDLALVRQLDGLLLQITAKGTEYDCVTRTFAPKMDEMCIRDRRPASQRRDELRHGEHR